MILSETDSTITKLAGRKIKAIETLKTGTEIYNEEVLDKTMAL